MMKGLAGELCFSWTSQSREQSPLTQPCPAPAQLCAHCSIPTAPLSLPYPKSSQLCSAARGGPALLMASSHARSFWQGNYSSITLGSVGMAPSATKAPPTQRCSLGAHRFQPTLPVWECIPRVEAVGISCISLQSSSDPGGQEENESTSSNGGRTSHRTESCHFAPASNRCRSERRG